MKSYQFYTKLVFSCMVFMMTILSSTTTFAQCDNVTAGGTIGYDQASNLPFDPQPIVNVTSPTGGTGALEYQWLYTTNPYNTNFSQWTMIPNGTSANYDPSFTTATTFFVRCARRAGCTDYVKESNIVVVTVSPCDNITDGGKITSNQIGCNAGQGADPAPFTNATSASGGTGSGPIEYAWFKSTVGGTFNLSNPNWIQILGANAASYDPPAGLTATTYYVRVARRNGCITWLASNSVSVTMKMSPMVTWTTVPNTCFGGSNGSINLTVAGGTAPYAYSWSYGSILPNTQNPKNLPATVYNVTVTDGSTCMAMHSITVTEPAPMAIDFNPTVNVKCYNDNTGKAVAQVTGGTAPYSYLWSNGATAPVNNGLAAGKYFVTVTDIKGCQKAKSVDITQPFALTATTTNTNVKCFGGSDASATVTASGGTAPYTYFWSNGQTSTTATGLKAGVYAVVIRDANLCEVSVSVNITQPTVLDVSTTKVDPSCNGAATGSVTLTTTGGTTPYSYAWSNGASTQNLTNVAAGTYTVTVTDANGCKKISVVTLNQPTAIVLNTTSTNVKCNGGSTGSAASVVTGGTAPYGIQWSNGATTASISNIKAGTYTLTVTDNNGCTKTGSVTITEPSALVATMTGSDLACGGANTGTASVIASGGTAPYKYKWSNGATSASLTNLTTGIYTVTVTDGNACTVVGQAQITQPTPIELTSVSDSPKCNNGNDGTATVSVSGGSAPYTYAWSNGGTTATVKGLTPGTYTVTVTDKNGCSKFLDIPIANPAPIVVVPTTTNVLCNNGKGGISLAISGGQSPYTVNWNNGANGTPLTNVGAGTYTATVTDALGCTQVVSAEIKQPAAIVLTPTITNVKCNGQSTGAASIAINGGVAPYSTLWSTGSTANSITGLLAGSYTVTVTDGNGCKSSQAIVISEPTILDVAVAANDEKCFGQKNGSAIAVATGGTAPYKYTWSNGSTSSSITNLVPGTYTVTITDKNNCKVIGTANVKAATELTVTVSVKSDVACFGEKTGSISLFVSGGSAPYAYAWSNGGTSADATGLSAGVYSATVTDANGCVKVIQTTISQPASPLSAVTSTKDASCGNNNGSATVTAAGGTTSYSYAWSNGATTATISNIGAGDYTVTVTDSKGCTVVKSAKVIQPTSLVLATTQTNLKCAADKIGTATVTAAGGMAPYTYAWSTGATTTFVSGLGAGTYTVTVTDANGCKATESVTITGPDAIVVTASATPTLCNGASEGTVTASVVSGGTGPFGFKWSNGVGGASQNGLTAGTYTVTVTDQNGCTGTSSATVTQPTAVSVSTTSVSTICKGASNGSATATAAGGTAPYAFIWSTGATTATITNLGADTYYVTVTDANGCTASNIVKVSEPFAYKLDLTTSNINCKGGTDGSAKIIVTGGPAGGSYSIIWSTGATTSVVGGLGAGTYTVTVTDNKGCSTIANAVITEPSELTIVTSSKDATCNGNKNGSASVTAVNGGNGPYTYVWSNFATTSSINNLGAGVYSVTVKDANGCTKSATMVVKDAPALVCTAVVSSEVQTYNGTQGSGVASASGGTAPYSYKWSNNATTAAVTGLAAGTYTVTITDANGCTCSSTISLMNRSKIGNFVWFDQNGDGIQTPGEQGLANVTVTISGTKAGTNAPVSETVVTGANGEYSFDGLMAGTYKVTFKAPNEYMPTLANATFDDKDSDVDMTTFMTTNYTLGTGEFNQTIDAGFFKKVKIGDTVWFDKNKNGLQDGGESGFANIMVKLFKPGADNNFGTADDVLVESTLTDNTGMYMFLVMPGMKYQVEFMKSSIPAGYALTTQNVGLNDLIDSDANVNTGRSDIIMVMFGQNNDMSIDAGLYVPCDNIIDGGLVGPKSQILCGPGVAATINEIGAPSGGAGPIEYLWLKSTKGPLYVPGSTDWTPITGTNSASYSPGFLAQTTWFIRCARRAGCDAYSGESNVVMVSVNAIPTATIKNYPTTDICTLTMNNFVATTAGSTATYQWNFGQGAVPQNGTGLSVDNVMYNSPGQKTVTLNVTKDGCDASTSVTVNVIVCPGAGAKVAITTINALPVQNQRVDVSWETTDPTIDNVFVVERSKAGGKWEAVGTVNAADFNVLPYTFVDKKPTLGVNQYRVKHVDLVGDAVMSKIKNAMIFADLLKEVVIYPNPFTNKVNVELTKVTAKVATVEIVNSFGQVVKIVKIPGGQTRQEVDMSDLQSGFYIIKIDFDGVKTEVHKVMRQEQ